MNFYEKAHNMTHRQLVLDTETTGLKPEDGHRIIEIACVELIDRKLTGNHFHVYLNPDREIDQGAINVHGLTSEFLQDKPRFVEIATEFLDYVKKAELIIHNAPFDVGFLNHELGLWKKEAKKITHYCTIVDTLAIARAKHVGLRNNLDALCKRYKVDHSKRELHGALLDSNLLAQVYLAMTGGQGNFFDVMGDVALNAKIDVESPQAVLRQSVNVHCSSLSADEQKAHDAYLLALKARGKCIWDESYPSTVHECEY